MRTILVGRVNGLEFSINENYEVVCKDSKFNSVIKKSALKAIKESKETVKAGLKPVVVMDIADELERCKEVDIKVKKVIDYLGETTEICYLHVPRKKDCSKNLFLQGKFEKGETFKVLVDLSTQVLDKDGKLNQEYSDLLQSSFEGLAKKFGGRPDIPDRNYMIYKVFNEEVEGKIIEYAYFYQRDDPPGKIFY